MQAPSTQSSPAARSQHSTVPVSQLVQHLVSAGQQVETPLQPLKQQEASASQQLPGQQAALLAQQIGGSKKDGLSKKLQQKVSPSQQAVPDAVTQRLLVLEHFLQTWLHCARAGPGG